jgi:hypothetical protein
MKGVQLCQIAVERILSDIDDGAQLVLEPETRYMIQDVRACI